MSQEKIIMQQHKKDTKNTEDEKKKRKEMKEAIKNITLFMNVFKKFYKIRIKTVEYKTALLLDRGAPLGEPADVTALDKFIVCKVNESIRNMRGPPGRPVSYTHLTLPTIYSV